MNILDNIDFYKADHRNQYPKGTEMVFSNWTARSSRIKEIDKVVLFGLQYYIKFYLIERWNREFFQQDKATVVAKYKRRMKNAGINITYEHIEALHDLGYLPMHIMALPEGSKVPLGVPMFIMWNTHPNFFWLTNYLETSISSVVWGMCTNATIANRYREVLDRWAEVTGGNKEFVNWQGHDFSYRGMFGTEAAMMSGAAHLMSFTGTDTVPALGFLEEFYGADSDTELLGGSVPATEHSVMCMGEMDNEFGTFERLITETYPTGIVSIVSDTWDYWQVITEFLPRLKTNIMMREGTVTIRPDSGDPVKIICGDPDAPEGSPEYKGSIELMWEIFGGTVNDRGMKQLDPHINLIYGDSITIERCELICAGLAAKGFVPSVIFGIGSFTYQYTTRDTFGFAVKATAGIVNGVAKEIFKDPKTGVGSTPKKSARGLLAVYEENGTFVLKQQVDWPEVQNCAFRDVFIDGRTYNLVTAAEVRATLRGN